MATEWHSAMKTVGVVLLAAGLSRRMGEVNKLLLDIDGQPMVARMAKMFSETGAGDLVCVTGFEVEHVTEALAGMSVRAVHNPDFEDGQQSSVLVGLNAVSSECRHVIVALADQPSLSVEDVLTLASAHFMECRHRAAQEGMNEPELITVPYNEHGRGNPVMMTMACLRDVAGGKVSLGCRKLIDKHPEWVHRFDVDSEGFYLDIDRPQDWDRLSAGRQ
ncbi:nucleotidyltransferase family protein [Veronia pacifica]|uniref:MobA-like NTP transferase domain-containing protein n=1 Tax=Veronia pacifica TaxID=1080227 RepID=A0A1C3EEB3_9GAMM|nr:nucleotidyltransferase family protein [Veronia pacifica]ODA31578.1 hypothetical protein A8L45_16355 [Veronia pacifica]